MVFKRKITMALAIIVIGAGCFSAGAFKERHSTNKGTSALAEKTLKQDSSVEIEKSPEIQAYLDNAGVKVFAEEKESSLQNLHLTTMITNAGIVYIDPNAGVMFQQSIPNILDNSSHKFEPLSKHVVNDFINAIPNKIIAKAPHEKMIVDMFTDITCGWCQKVHQNLQEYLDAGITMRFILYPREGLDGETNVAKKMSTIVQDPNPLKALQDAMQGSYVRPAAQVDQTIVNNVTAGAGINVSATPVIIVNGYIIRGYVPAKTLAEVFLDKK